MLIKKKKKKIATVEKVETVEEGIEEEDDFEEQEDEDVEEEDPIEFEDPPKRPPKPAIKELPPLPTPPKSIIKKPVRQEIQDMIEGHLARATELLRFSGSLP